MNTTKKNASRAMIGLAAASAALVLIPGISSANDADVRVSGTCSGNSTWKLKAKPEDGGRIGVEFEVDSNKNGQTWKVTLKDDGTAFWSGTRTTLAPSGSFSVEKLTKNLAGTDNLVGRATNPATGEVCRGALAFSG